MNLPRSELTKPSSWKNSIFGFRVLSTLEKRICGAPRTEDWIWDSENPRFWKYRSTDCGFSGDLTREEKRVETDWAFLGWKFRVSIRKLRRLKFEFWVLGSEEKKREKMVFAAAIPTALPAALPIPFHSPSPFPSVTNTGLLPRSSQATATSPPSPVRQQQSPPHVVFPSPLTACSLLSEMAARILSSLEETPKQPTVTPPARPSTAKQGQKQMAPPLLPHTESTLRQPRVDKEKDVSIVATPFAHSLNYDGVWEDVDFNPKTIFLLAVTPKDTLKMLSDKICDRFGLNCDAVDMKFSTLLSGTVVEMSFDADF
ncbi:hypothetical protein LWI29_008867 [Acer saccharum]|uniref:Uncharacterized protein n=1 Tax=Acer saccharum TaxID=4024 RepID=A0AA39TBA0_ACESA|nr:hypothetical protein LWI29_008867 [Acer saccharum]